MEACQRTVHRSRDLPREQGHIFSDKILDLMQPVNQVSILKRQSETIVDSGGSMHVMSKVDLTPEEEETITVFKESHNSWSKRPFS